MLNKNLRYKLHLDISSVYTAEFCAASGRVYSTGPELHLDVSGKQDPELLLDVSTPQGLSFS